LGEVDRPQAETEGATPTRLRESRPVLVKSVCHPDDRVASLNLG